MIVSSFSVPLVVTAPMHKLTPYHFTACDQEALATFASPQDILKDIFRVDMDF